MMKMYVEYEMPEETIIIPKDEKEEKIFIV